MTPSETQPLRETRALPSGGLLVTLGNPRRPSTLTRETLRAIGKRLLRWENRPDLRWVAFASDHPTTFLAGADMAELGALSHREAPGFARLGQGLCSRFRDSRIWLVACIDGACIGGGLDFALACDYRIASGKARFSHPGPRLGILTGWGGTVTLPRLGGRGALALLHGETLDTGAALDAGWIEESAPDPIRRAILRARGSGGLDLASLKRRIRAAALPVPSGIVYERLLARG